MNGFEKLTHPVDSRALNFNNKGFFMEKIAQIH
jgi:hypothetical protein